MSLDRLRKIAEAASKGSWRAEPDEDDPGWYYVTNGEYGIAVEASCADAAHIAAFNPSTALSLIAVAQAAEPALKALELCERSIVLIGNACNEKHVSEAIMVRALDAQIECIDASRSAIAALRAAMAGMEVMGNG